ncbi:unnamed protein product (macronuclear) [Paramecium tetraurelia]|uniref:Transmembrane protein n=1 Tax=Paramecium tetraurelia TaxID=5888 RepID=A0D5G8_PARTE|nr:uncharacterized protein GSPATT00039268001 [Paramecium tetraurelia]CAK78285.1 unnamed protein product [Paramecium tetraurelia]|eukprot:XP_001445682.1 hypothetical protein (macronuclear) [Paramecium tetraurelia strain d4-2]
MQIQNNGHSEKTQTIKSQNSFNLRFWQNPPEPNLSWRSHTTIDLFSDFSDFINARYQEVKRRSSDLKSNAKIGFQVAIYILNIFELGFTLGYKSHNNIPDNESVYLSCYYLSIIMCALLHSVTCIYTFRFRQVVKLDILSIIGQYFISLIEGLFSYFKLAPFIHYYNRNKSIKQFSFSEINKYLILEDKDKFRNSARLFKKRTKPVNMFRDLIFHRVALVSMIITLCLQTLPQLFIQGFYNTKEVLWDDGYNVFTYILLIFNGAYYLIELIFIVFTTSYRQMQTEIQFKLHKIKLKYLNETKQLLKSDEKYMAFVKSFYFHIDPSNFNSYQKKRCMVQIITFLTSQKQFQNIQFHFIDGYESVTLQYLANCFRLIKVEKISLLYKNQSMLNQLRDIFPVQEFTQLKIEYQEDDSMDYLWDNDKFDADAEEERIQEIQFIENPKLNSGFQVVTMNQNGTQENDFIILSEEFKSVNYEMREDSNKIIEKAKSTIKVLTKTYLLSEKLGRFKFLLVVKELYDAWSQLTVFQAALQSIWTLINLSFSIISLIYITNNLDPYITSLLGLAFGNFILQLISFIIFQERLSKDFSFLEKAIYALIFGLLNLIKVWDIAMIIMYNFIVKFHDLANRPFNAEGYKKFKSYASKFKGSLPISVFQFVTVSSNSEGFFAMKQLPFYEAVMWRASVEEALNKIPQLFVHILALSSNGSTGLWVISFLQQLKEGVQAVKDILEITIKDFYIPALILSTVSVEQFYQSMLYLNSISNQILLEYPKSFQIMSKVKESYIKNKCTFKINLKTLDFSNYEGDKKEKMLAQFRQVLASIQSVLEIDQAQRLLCMGPEINDFVKCIKASQIFSLKLNFNLDEIRQQDLQQVNSYMEFFPSKLKFLQISVETFEERKMNFKLGNSQTIRWFSYSYYQIIKQYRQQQINPSQAILNIDDQFIRLDRYNFEGLFFEVAGNLQLQKCHTLFQRFQNLKAMKISLKNLTNEMISFNFYKNISGSLQYLDLTFENLLLDFSQFSFNNLKNLKLIIKKCQFSKVQFSNILRDMNNGKEKKIYIELIKVQEFQDDELKYLVRLLEQKKFEVTIKKL